MEILGIINNFGFPVFSFIACGCALKYEYDHSMQNLKELTEAVNNNTKTLAILAEKINEEDKN